MPQRLNTVPAGGKAGCHGSGTGCPELKPGVPTVEKGAPEVKRGALTGGAPEMVQYSSKGAT